MTIAVGSLWPSLDVGATLGTDSVAHMVSYGVLTATALLGWRALPCLLIAAACGAFGAGLEALQALVPGRAPSWSDCVANVATAATLVMLGSRFLKEN